MAHDPGIAEDCTFCRIAQGKDSAAEVICAGEGWVAFFPLEPATPGHTLVIPREHIPDVWSLGPELGAELMSAVVRVGRAIQTAVTPAGMNLISSSGEAAEQSIYHLHLHVVPRYPGDDIDPIWPDRVHSDRRLEEDLAQRIRDACEQLAVANAYDDKDATHRDDGPVEGPKS